VRESHIKPLANASRIETSLGRYPRSWVVIPFVSGVRNGTEGRFDQLVPPLVIERAFDGTGDERASLSWTDLPVQLANDLVVQRNV